LTTLKVKVFDIPAFCSTNQPILKSTFKVVVSWYIDDQQQG